MPRARNRRAGYDARAPFPIALPLWMDVPSRERPAFAGMTGFCNGLAHGARLRFFTPFRMTWRVRNDVAVSGELGD